MSIPRTVQVGPLVAAVATGYATAQAGTAGTPLLLNGSLTTAGVGNVPVARRLVITSAGNDAGITFTIVGRSAVNGSLQTEVMQGTAGAATNAQGLAYSSLDYIQVISITPSGNTAGNVTAGTSVVASSPWIRLDNFSFAPVALEVDVTGTVSYTVEGALRDPNIVTDRSLVTPSTGPAPIAPYQMVWLPHSTLVAQTASAFDQYSQVPTWVRCTQASGTGSCVFTASQPVSGLRL